MMKIGIVGLGLIGGSAAKAYKAAGHTVYGYDINHTVTGYACLDSTLDGELTPEQYAGCDIILLTATPKAVVEYLKQNAPSFPKGALVVDFCGVKLNVCKTGFSLAKKYGFTFVGAHPMAGLQFSGYKYSRATLFNGASLIMVPPTYDDIALLDNVKMLLSPLGFKKYVVTTAQHHDKMIAYTSQMCHVVSNAFIKSPTALEHKGYSAGSFRDFTRVSRLNENMWTELFLDNRENLLTELDLLIKSLSEYRDAIEERDSDRLRDLLRDGRVAKELTEK